MRESAHFNLPSQLARPRARFDSRRRFGLLLLLMPLALGCGADADRRYAGLATRKVDLAEAGYRLRYLSPPWQRTKSDPLDSGARKSVTIGGVSTPIVEGSGTVLEIDRESTIDDLEGLSFPKYRLEAALVTCAAEDTQDLSCAQHLARLDYDARQSEGPFDAFGSEPRAGKNDAGQDYYELMGQTTTTRRRRRAVFVAGDKPERVAAWILIEGNPELDEREITELVQAFELVPGSEATP